MKKKLYKYAPPGVDIKTELKFMFGILICVIVVFSLWYSYNFSSAYEKLCADENFSKEYSSIHYDYRVLEPIVKPIMPDFLDIIDVMKMPHFFLFFSIGNFLFFSIYHYSVYYKGSKSVYLMRRLPNRSPMLRQIFVVPVISGCAYLVTLIVLFFVFIMCYLLFTPEDCLLINQWEKIWRELI